MEMEPLITIGKVADIIDIPPSTARQYVKDFRHTDVFSDTANPPPKQTRLFDDDDIRVMWTIKYLRMQRKSTDDIAAALIAGERYYPDAGQDAQDNAGETETIDTDEPSRDAPINALVKFQDTVNDLTNQLIESERARVAAETELKIIKQMLENESKKRWWRFWD